MAASIKADGFSENRYRDCTIVRVPEQCLEEFRAFNSGMAAVSPLLAAHSPKMIYAALTKHLGQTFEFMPYVHTLSYVHAQARNALYMWTHPPPPHVRILNLQIRRSAGVSAGMSAIAFMHVRISEHDFVCTYRLAGGGIISFTP